MISVAVLAGGLGGAPAPPLDSGLFADSEDGCEVYLAPAAIKATVPTAQMYVAKNQHQRMCRTLIIPKSEVYTAYRAIKNIMSQARKEPLVIDPYVDEDLLDVLASLDPSVKIRVLTEHLN